MFSEVWKTPITISDEQFISVPLGSKPLSCQMQDGTPCIWWLVDPHAPANSVSVHVYGTGQNMYTVASPEDSYFATVLDDGLVWHIFIDNWRD